jgi:hypothetical protein
MKDYQPNTALEPTAETRRDYASKFSGSRNSQFGVGSAFVR